MGLRFLPRRAVTLDPNTGNAADSATFCPASIQTAAHTPREADQELAWESTEQPEQ